MAVRKQKSKARSTRQRFVPSFAARTELALYVDPDDLGRGGRVSSTAFLPNPDDKYLSVNSLELESIETIAAYYQERFKGGVGQVAIAHRKVWDYTDAGRFAGLSIDFNKTVGKWEYDTGHGLADAYKHIRQTRVPKSNSHCGVQFINAQTAELVVNKIARRLAHRRPQRPTII
jgi:hypothetical protein